MIAVDNTLLTLMLHPAARPPKDPSTGLPVAHIEERVELLIETIDKDREQIIIPTPVLSEFLILAGNDGPHYLSRLDKRAMFRIESFDIRAAVELAAIELSIKKTAKEKRDGVQEPWTKVKFDRQIVTIAKVNGASKIYSDDDGVEKFAKRCGIPVVKTWEMPLRQGKQNTLMDLVEKLDRPTESENNGEKETTIGTEEESESALAGVSAVSESNQKLAVSSEEGSGRAGSEAGEE